MSAEELAIRDAPPDLAEVMELADTMVRSNFFTDASTAVKATVKILAGRELGLGPVESMRSFHIVENKVEFAAEFLAQRVRQHPHYSYRVLELENDRCVVEFFEDGESIGVSKFDDHDRELAELSLKTEKGKATSWAKYPRNMLFARAMSNGVAWYCPDVVAGVPSVVIDVVRPEMPGQVSLEESSSVEVVPIGGDLGDSTDEAAGTSEAGSHAALPEDPAAERPELTTSGEASEVEPVPAEAHSTAPPPDAPHDHIAGSQRTASGKALCVFENPDGTVCGVPFKPKPTVHTAPVDDDEERADLA